MTILSGVRLSNPDTNPTLTDFFAGIRTGRFLLSKGTMKLYQTFKREIEAVIQSRRNLEVNNKHLNIKVIYSRDGEKW